MKDLSPILKSLGFLDSEIRTYLAALELGPSTVIDIAKKTALSRQATYLAIEALEKRGLISSVLSGKKNLFASEPPEKLLAYAKRHSAEMHARVGELEAALPELALRIGGEKPVVRVFEGKEGIRAILEDIAATKSKDAVEITDLDAMYSVLSPDDLKNMRDTLVKVGAVVRGIYSGSPRIDPLMTERHMLPKDMSGFRSNIGIYGNKLMMVTFDGKMHSLIIESPTLTKTMRVLFELALKGHGKQD